MANNSVFLNIATILWAVNIAALKDEAGKPIVPNTLEGVQAGIVMSASIQLTIYVSNRLMTISRRPLPFDCVITPRFPDVKSVITHTRELLE